MYQPIETDLARPERWPRSTSRSRATGGTARRARRCRRLREEMVPATVGTLPGADVAATAIAGGADFNAMIEERAPLVIGFQLAPAFVLLLIAFRSVLVPATAIILTCARWARGPRGLPPVRGTSHFSLSTTRERRVLTLSAGGACDLFLSQAQQWVGRRGSSPAHPTAPPARNEEPRFAWGCRSSARKKPTQLLSRRLQHSSTGGAPAWPQTKSVGLGKFSFCPSSGARRYSISGSQAHRRRSARRPSSLQATPVDQINVGARSQPRSRIRTSPSSSGSVAPSNHSDCSQRPERGWPAGTTEKAGAARSGP